MTRLGPALGVLLWVALYTAAMLLVGGIVAFVFTYGDCNGPEAVCQVSDAARRATLLRLLLVGFLLSNLLLVWLARWIRR